MSSRLFCGFHIHINVVEVEEATSNKEDNFEDGRICKNLRDFYLEKAENNHSNQMGMPWENVASWEKRKKSC